MKSIKTNKFQKIKNWIKNHKKVVVSGVIILSLAAGGVVYMILNQPKEEVSEPKVVKTEKKAEEKKYYSPLTGMGVGQESDEKIPVIGVMIENSPAARPQSGLKNSGVVFEAVAEAGITRFLALYQMENPELVGPVRSLREYYLDWSVGFNSSIAHVGGSGGALARVRDGNHRDMDQFYNANSFWRSTDRYAPHNVYTSSQNLRELNNQKGWTTSEFTGFKRKDKTSEAGESATNISVSFGQSGFNTSYTYDVATNSYNRFLEGEASLDREAGQITPKNVVAMKVNMSLDSDGYHNQIQTIGSGEAVAFLDGKAFAITWEKASETAPLIFKNQDGKEFELNRGQTWIAAVPVSQGSISWQ